MTGWFGADRVFNRGPGSSGPGTAPRATARAAGAPLERPVGGGTRSRTGSSPDTLSSPGEHLGEAVRRANGGGRPVTVRSAGIEPDDEGMHVPTTVSYGDHSSQTVRLWDPEGGTDGPAPVAVLLHGGWWRDRFDAALMDPLARDLAAGGWAVWNVEYRRTGVDGGGWPRTLDDVGDALALLAEAAAREPGRYDLGRVVSVGHSAGGHLALLNALDARTPVTAVVALAPITDLERCAGADLGEGAVGAFLGPDPSAEAYASGSPVLRVPFGVPQLVVHGGADQRVPVEHSRDYADAAREAGDRVDYHEPAGADHFAVIDPAHPAWQRVRGYMAGPH